MRSIKKQVEIILTKPLSCHPSREDEIRFKEALLLLAQQIDILYEFKKDN
jgi:hypothetical protein